MMLYTSSPNLRHHPAPIWSYIEVSGMRSNVITAYRRMRRAGIDPFWARITIIDLLFTGQYYATWHRADGPSAWKVDTSQGVTA
jgi:hypothetical protein